MANLQTILAEHQDNWFYDKWPETPNPVIHFQEYVTCVSKNEDTKAWLCMEGDWSLSYTPTHYTYKILKIPKIPFNKKQVFEFWNKNHTLYI